MDNRTGCQKKSDMGIQDHRAGDRKTRAVSKSRNKPVNVMCDDD